MNILEEITKLLGCNTYSPGEAFDSLLALRRERVTPEQLRDALNGKQPDDLNKVNTSDEYTDDTPMPFGKYSRPPNKCNLGDVPPGYFHWLWSNRAENPIRDKRLERYIERNIPAFKEEQPDLIWRDYHKPQKVAPKPPKITTEPDEDPPF